MPIKTWEVETTVTPTQAISSTQWFQPVIGNLESLRDKGTTYLTERNQHGEGCSAVLTLEGSTLRIEYDSDGGMDYGVEQLARIIGRILQGDFSPAPSFNSCVH